MAFAGPAVVETLVEGGASPTARTKLHGVLPPHMAAMFGVPENLEAWVSLFDRQMYWMSLLLPIIIPPRPTMLLGANVSGVGLGTR